MTVKNRIVKLEVISAAKVQPVALSTTLEDELLRQKIGRRLEEVTQSGDLPALEAFCEVLNDAKK